MPLYSYICTNPECENHFDKIVPHFDTERREPCPKCGEPSDFTIPQGSRSGVKFLMNYMEP